MLPSSTSLWRCSGTSMTCRHFAVCMRSATLYASCIHPEHCSYQSPTGHILLACSIAYHLLNPKYPACHGCFDRLIPCPACTVQNRQHSSSKLRPACKQKQLGQQQPMCSHTMQRPCTCFWLLLSLAAWILRQISSRLASAMSLSACFTLSWLLVLRAKLFSATKHG